jgi:subtilisin-like proprotein convertase family protein
VCALAHTDTGQRCRLQRLAQVRLRTDRRRASGYESVGVCRVLIVCGAIVVRAAVHWKPMPKYALRIDSGYVRLVLSVRIHARERTSHTPYSVMRQTTDLSPGTPLVLTYTIPSSPSNTRFVIEHVEVNVTMDISSRGALALVMTSPAGTVSRFQVCVCVCGVLRVLLLTRCRQDVHRDQGAQIANCTRAHVCDVDSHTLCVGRYSSIFSWGESPVGNWTLKVLADLTRHPKATFQSWNVLMHGCVQVLMCVYMMCIS